MIRIAPKPSTDYIPDAIYQKYASELREYVDVSFDISVEEGRIRYIPTWIILKSDNPRWETCRSDETNYFNRIETALLNRMADDEFGYGKMMPIDFWQDARKYTYDIVGEFVSEKLTPLLLNRSMDEDQKKQLEQKL